jgi:hypothetical protein
MSRIFILLIVISAIALTSQNTANMLRAKGGFTPEGKQGSVKAHQGQSILSERKLYNKNLYDIKKQEYYGVKGFSGYVTINRKKNNKVFFSYMINKNGIENAPVVIGNPGGPGM